MAELSIGEVYRAQMVLKDVARHPKIIGPTDFSDNCRIYLKPENLQHTGSFKLRGAWRTIYPGSIEPPWFLPKVPAWASSDDGL